MKTLPWSSILIVAGSIVALYSFDRLLEKVEQSELQREANLEHETGMALLAQGRTDAALPHLSRASVLNRTNRSFQLDLAGALLEAGQREQAETNLRDVLSEDSNDGRANLLMARLMVNAGRSTEADAYYHRAIYGTWYLAPQSSRLQARLELADYLSRQDRKQELLSELLVLQDATRADPALAGRVAQLFLASGSPARAVSAYQDIIRANSADADAYVGLGEAQVRAGNFRGAETAFLGVLRCRPDDPDAARRLKFATMLEHMDPTPRRLSSAEKYGRSTALLAAVRDSVAANCPAAINNPDAKPLFDEAEKAMKSKPRGPVTNETSEAVISLAEQLWSKEMVVCGAKQRTDDPVPVLMDKLKIQ
jgi:Flp pilus assembly protein TadD